MPPAPPVAEAEAIAALYRAEHCDSFVAVGGGSPMDAAKAAAALLARPHRTLAQMAGLLKVRRPIPVSYTLLRLPMNRGGDLWGGGMMRCEKRA